MRDLYSDDYASVVGDGTERLIPEGVRKLSGAAVFLALVAALGLWSYRLGTRDAAEVPIIRAMDGPARVEPQEPGGLQAAHQGLEVNAVLGGKPAPMPRELAAAAPEPMALKPEDAPQGELVLATPAMMAEKVLGESGELPVPPAEDTVALVPDADPEPDVVAALPPTADAAAGPRPMNRPANLVRARKAPAPEAKPVGEKVAALKVEKVAASKPAAVTPAAAQPAAREATGVKAGARLVQLGAFDSEENTRKAWSQLVAGNGDLLSAKSLYVERTTANARVFYRLRVAGFADPEETRQMCEALRARGVACIPVTLQ